MSSAEKHLYLIDGHALAYRSYFGMIKSRLSTSAGQPTGAVYGFAVTILRLLELYKCPYVAVVFDSHKPSFRKELYEHYKANREEMPDDMKSQIPLIFELVKAFNLISVMQDGLEADDIIAHLTREAVGKGFEVSLVTKDKDLMQLVGNGVRMLAPDTNGKIDVYGPSEVEQKMGVPPEKIRDLLALMGDSSDNIPGVPGVGPKTAAKILAQAENLDKLIADPSIAGSAKLSEKISQNVDALVMSRELATLKPDVALDVTVEQLKARSLDREQCAAFFQKMEFRSLLSNPLFDIKERCEFRWTAIGDLDTLREVIRGIEAKGFVSIDTETTSTNPREAKLVGISLSTDPEEGVYIPVGHARGDNLPLDKVLEELGPMVGSDEVAKIGQNLKYDYQVFRNHGIVMRGIAFDTMIAAYLLDPGRRQYNLDALAREHLGSCTLLIETLIGKGKSQSCFSEVAIEEAAEYAAEDAIVPMRLKEIFEPELRERNLSRLFEEVEMPIVPVLAEMEWHGMLVDHEFLHEMSKEYAGRLEVVCRDIYGLAGEEFNLNSPKQVGEVLFVKLGLPRSRKTKTGMSTDVAALEKLSREHEIARRILDYRELQKLLSTYIDALPNQVFDGTGRLHSSFNQTVAATGRLSSANPNLQNIPIRTEEGRRIRKAFIASKGTSIVSADYSQIELRILAHVSGDTLLRRAFLEDQDIHTQTAAAIYGIFPEAVSSDMRRAAKTINFGLMYGMGPINLSRQLGISFKDAQAFIETYFAQFPSIRSYMDTAITKARECGFTETLMGRRRYLPDIDAKSRQIREAAERTAINTPIQGTAADIIKVAMIRIHRAIGDKFPGAKLLLQVHDELVFEVPNEIIDPFRAWIIEEMSGALALDVPLKVDAGVGANWLEAH